MVSAVEYRLFRKGQRGQLHREHLLLTTLDSREQMADALVKARRRLRFKALMAAGAGSRRRPAAFELSHRGPRDGMGISTVYRVPCP